MGDVLYHLRRWLGTTDHYDGSKEKLERWKKHDILRPEDADAHSGHDAVWTYAPGVWYCRTCHEWYRTWENTPQTHPDQGEGFRHE